MTVPAPPSGHVSARIWLPGALSFASLAAIGMVVAGPGLAILIALGLTTIAVAVWMPGVVFAAYLLIPFYKGAIQPYLPIDVTVLLAVLNAAQLIPFLRGRLNLMISRSGMLLWVALACLILAGALYAPDQALAVSKVANWDALVFLPMLAAVRVGSNPRHVRQFLWTFFGFGLLVVVLGVAMLSTTQRLTLLGTNTIGVGRAALFVPLVGLTFVLYAGRRSLAAIAVALVPAAIVVELASGSRGPLLVLLGIGFLGSVRYVIRPRSIDWGRTALLAGAVVASAIVVSAVAVDLPGASTDRFLRFGEFVEGSFAGDEGASTVDTSAGSRVALFVLAVDLFEERPILGFGTAGYQALSPRYLPASQAEDYPHNTLLQFAAEFGVVGASLFVFLVALGLWRALPAARTSSAIRALFLFFLLNAMISGDIYTDRPTWGLLMLVLCIASQGLPDADIVGAGVAPGSASGAGSRIDLGSLALPAAIQSTRNLRPARTE